MTILARCSWCYTNAISIWWYISHRNTTSVFGYCKRVHDSITSLKFIIHSFYIRSLRKRDEVSWWVRYYFILNRIIRLLREKCCVTVILLINYVWIYDIFECPLRINELLLKQLHILCYKHSSSFLNSTIVLVMIDYIHHYM